MVALRSCLTLSTNQRYWGLYGIRLGSRHHSALPCFGGHLLRFGVDGRGGRRDPFLQQPARCSRRRLSGLVRLSRRWRQGVGWGHWFRGGSNPHDPNSLAVDLWPDTSELAPDERCPTAFHLPSGAEAFLFSDQNPKTVARHFAWMKQYGIDGGAMQRFLTNIVHPDLKRNFDTVLDNARAGAEANHRGFFVMYDISGMRGDAALQAIEQDWPHLTGDLHLTESPAYMFDRGKPIVGVWGLGFKDRDINPAQAAALIRYLRTASVPATVLGGVPTSWRNLGSDGRYTDSHTEPQWGAVYRSLDVISPWTVGRFSDDTGADNYARQRLIPDIAETRRLGIEYMPVVFPGFSWHHGADRQATRRLI